ncbi:MAG TPA: hypothetical protein PLJ29_05500 [Leptospiraceae bacterium]|nr:hypothetical protein [Leptospiraceae bacterium]HNI25793.1 hypothetical protein [Leptospiraceae bacterium]HNO24911.1 hypothetical protein [Leptospiraceae bacterium]
MKYDLAAGFAAMTVLIFSSGCSSLNTEERKAERILWKDVTASAYHGKTMSQNKFAELKKEELKKFKSELEAVYRVPFKYRYTKYFNIAYRCSDSDADRIERNLKIFFRDVYPKYYIYEPKFTMRIVYFGTKKEFIKHTNYDSYGYYMGVRDSENDTNRTLYTYWNSGPGTLWHEMIHAFTDANTDMDVDSWFNEGMASFYEHGSTADGRFTEGYANWRLPALQETIRAGRLPGLRKFFEKGLVDREYGYPYMRFLFCYLWIHDQMIPFVKAYIYELLPKYKGSELTGKSIETMERLLGKNISEIEKDMSGLALKLKKNEKLVKLKERK